MNIYVYIGRWVKQHANGFFLFIDNQNQFLIRKLVRFVRENGTQTHTHTHTHITLMLIGRSTCRKENIEINDLVNHSKWKRKTHLFFWQVDEDRKKKTIVSEQRKLPKKGKFKIVWRTESRFNWKKESK